MVSDEGDVSEVLRLAERFALPRGRILLQAESVRREELLDRSSLHLPDHGSDRDQRLMEDDEGPQ